MVYEYYALQEYAKTNTNEEIYAVKNGDQYYLTDSDGNEIMAKKKNNLGKLVSYFAFDANGIPICPLIEKDQIYLNIDILYHKNDKNIQIYPRRKNQEYYIGNKYAKDATDLEYFATDSNSKKYYASSTLENGDTVQFPAVDHKSNNIYIEENDVFVYPLNLTKNIPVYLKDKDGKEIYLEKNGNQIYGCNMSNLPIYAKEKNNSDYFALKNSIPYYAFFENKGSKFEYYPKMKDKKQFYLKKGNKEIYTKFSSDEKYAQLESLQEYLARDNGVPYHATNQHNIETYPRSNNNCFYRIENSIEKVAVNKTNMVGYYATDMNQSEVYPKNFNEIPDMNSEIVDGGKLSKELLDDNNILLTKEPSIDEITEHISSRD